MIRKVDTFVDDEKGFEIKVLKPLPSVEGISSKFQGSAMVMLTMPSGQQRPQQFSFQFPEEIKTLEDAFLNFETYIKEELDRQEEEFKRMMLEKQKEKERQLILPGNKNITPFNGDPNVIPFPGIIK